MTPPEFIEEAKSFKSGCIYVMSGPDIDAVINLLYLARTAIQTTGRDAVVYDFRCRPLGDPVPGGCTVYADEGIPPTRRWLGDKYVQSLLWENYSLLIQKLTDEGNPMIMLIGNTFDPDDRIQNPSPISVPIDVIRDLMNLRNVSTVVSAFGHAPLTGFTRELYQFITGIYFYDTQASEVNFIKERLRQRPDTIGNAQSFTIIYPLLNQQIKRGKILQVSWDSYDIPRGSDVKVDLYQGSSFYRTLANSAPEDGKFIWKLPVSFATGNDFFVRLTLLSTPYSVFADSSSFSII